MASILAGPGKPNKPEHHIVEDVVHSDATRHILAIVLALVLVVMVVSALLLSANEGASSERQAAADRIHAVEADMK